MNRRPPMRAGLKPAPAWHGAAALLLCGVLAACTTVYDDPEVMQSFRVKLTKKTQDTGKPEKRLPFVAGTSCKTVTCQPGEACVGYCALGLETCSTDADCMTGDLCNRLCAMPVRLDISALGSEGGAFVPGKDVWVSLSVHPGFIPPPWTSVKLEKGKASNVLTYISRAIGESYIWVEDLGKTPVEKAYDECNDGLDNDSDGLVDLADPDCLGPEDGSEAAPSYATGLSPAFWFETPKIRHIQYTDVLSTSPLQDSSIYVNSGAMVVTNIVAGGFFVTDLTDNVEEMPNGLPGYFNSMFLYTFNQPDSVHYGDTLCSFSGGVVEYQGNTQVKYPGFEVMEEKILYDADWNEVLDDKGKPVVVFCSDREVTDADKDLRVPDPTDVTDLLTPEDPSGTSFTDETMKNGTALEPFESGLVKIRDLSMSTRFLACDANENGYIDKNTDEDLCRDECQKDNYCTQLESYFKYQQVAVFANLGKKFYLAQEALKELNPLSISYIGQTDQNERCVDYTDSTSGEKVTNPHKLLIGETWFIEYLCPPIELESVSGNYRQIYMCNDKPGKAESCGLQLSMIMPRFDKDVVRRNAQ